MLPIISTADVPIDTRRGGQVQTLLSPRTVGSTSGFMGVARLAPGESDRRALPPVLRGVPLRRRGAPRGARRRRARTSWPPSRGCVLPINTRHRLVNRGAEEAHDRVPPRHRWRPDPSSATSTPSGAAGRASRPPRRRPPSSASEPCRRRRRVPDRRRPPVLTACFMALDGRPPSIGHRHTRRPSSQLRTPALAAAGARKSRRVGR